MLLKTRFADPEGALELDRELLSTRLEYLGREDEETTAANKRVVDRLNALGRSDEAVAAGQTLCWLLESDDAALTPMQRNVRDAMKGACSE